MQSFAATTEAQSAPKVSFAPTPSAPPTSSAPQSSPPGQ